MAEHCQLAAPRICSIPAITRGSYGASRLQSAIFFYLFCFIHELYMMRATVLALAISVLLAVTVAAQTKPAASKPRTYRVCFHGYEEFHLSRGAHAMGMHCRSADWFSHVVSRSASQWGMESDIKGSDIPSKGQAFTKVRVPQIVVVPSLSRPGPAGRPRVQLCLPCRFPLHEVL